MFSLSKIPDLMGILRPWQWYKNAVVFLGMIFSGEALLGDAIIKSLLAFAALCALSSAGYIINDIRDAPRDRLHPEKQTRSIASGKISPLQAAAIAVLLAVAGGVMAYKMGAAFFALSSVFFALSILYTFWFRNVYIADVTVIGILFSLRAVAGVVAIGVFLSPWLIVCTFLIAVFLALGKRKADAAFLGAGAERHRKVLQEYKGAATDAMLIASMSSIIMSYSIYSILVRTETHFMLTMPVAIFLVFRYGSFVFAGNQTARNPEHIFRDLPFVIGMIIWAALVFLAIYFR